MPHVVPSEIVRVIDGFFPEAASLEKPKLKLDVSKTGRVSAVLALIDKLPEQLLVFPPAAYADFVADLEMLRSKASGAAKWGSSYHYSGEHVWRLRHALAQCPDTAATSAAHELRFLRPRAFRDELRRDLTEAYQSLNEGRWKAATVLAGSVIEALLVWRLSRVPSAQRRSVIETHIPDPKQRPKGAPEDWKLWQLIVIAAQLEVITPDTATQIGLAKNYRNLIHPGRAQRKGERCGKHTALGALSGVERILEEVSKWSRPSTRGRAPNRTA